MRIFRIGGFALAAAASIWPITALAAGNHHPNVRIVVLDDGSQQAQVRLHDLDLLRDAEIGELERRVRTVTRHLCRTSAISRLGSIRVLRCRKAALADSQNLIKAAISLARRNETLAALTIERPPPSKFSVR